MIDRVPLAARRLSTRRHALACAGHAEVIRDDMTVFAHLHPSRSVAMPALALTHGGSTDAMGTMPGMHMDAAALPADLAFPYGFPQPGSYRIFVQIKRGGQIQTAAFDATVEP